MRNVKRVKLKNITFGDGNIYIQSMLNTNSNDIEGSVKQAVELEKAGCDIIRFSVLDEMDAKSITAVKKNIQL